MKRFSILLTAIMLLNGLSLFGKDATTSSPYLEFSPRSNMRTSLNLALQQTMNEDSSKVSISNHPDYILPKKVLLFSGPIVAISFIFIWTPPHPTTGFGISFIPLIIFLTFFSFLFRLMVGFFQPTLYSLLPELSTDEQNRVKASMVNMLMMLVGTVIGAIGPILLLGDATQGLTRDDPTLFITNSVIGQTIATQIILFSTVI